MKQDPLFLPHGAPNLAVTASAAHDFLKEMGPSIAAAKALVVISPHWETKGLKVSAAGPLKTIHDFRGFSEELHQMNYDGAAPQWLVGSVIEAVSAAGLEIEADDTWGLDHGTWVPLILALPENRLPIVQVSLPLGYGAAESLALGRALAPLAERGILVIGTGAITHNFREMGPESQPIPEWAVSFDKDVENALALGDAAILDLKNHAHYQRVLPTDEHLMPLFVAYGAAGEGAAATKLHESWTHRALSMSAYRFAA